MTTDGFEFSQDGKILLNCDFPQIGTFVNVPDGCEKIDNGVFAEAPIVNVLLPDSINELGENVFSSSETLKSVDLGKSLKELKPFTFSGCSSLESINFSKTISSIPDGLFLGCSSLKEIPECPNVESIGFDAFRDCESLESIEIPPKVKQIKKGTFAGCSNLQKIVFPESLESIEDRSLFGLKSLNYMSFNGDNETFFIDEDYGCLYKNTPDGVILIRCPVNQQSIKLIENTYDIHIDAFDNCASLEEVFVYESAPEEFVNKLLELVPHLDVNSYGEEDFESSSNENIESDLQDQILEANQDVQPQSEDTLSSEQNIDITLEEEADIQNAIDTTEESSINVQQDIEATIDIQSIVNEQCCRNDALTEGFNPVTLDEIEKLFPNATKNESVQENIEETEELFNDESDLQIDSPEETEELFNDESDLQIDSPEEAKINIELENDSSEEISNTLDSISKEIAKDNISLEEIADPLAQCFSVEEIPMPAETELPRFIKTLQKLSSHQLILEQKENENENVYGELKDLYVFADGVAPSTNEFSSHLVKFAKSVAKKYGFTKIFFFNDLPIDNPEFIYGLESFGSLRNVLYACDKSNTELISETQKELINAAGISLPSSNFKNVKEDESDENLNYPVKILVQDNYVEGLLYCAEKYREANGIN